MVVMNRSQGCCQVCRILLCMYFGSDTLKLDAGWEDARREVAALPAGVMDAPETKEPRKPVQYFGKEATAFTRKSAEG
jgi:hypothetical protein